MLTAIIRKISIGCAAAPLHDVEGLEGSLAHDLPIGTTILICVIREICGFPSSRRQITYRVPTLFTTNASGIASEIARAAS